MKKNIIYLPILLFFVSLSGCATSTDLTTVDSVNLDRYVGTWYEIAKIPNWFQKDCARNTTATYRAIDEKLIEVVNQCQQAGGQVKEARGVARVVENSDNTKLEVSFVRFLGRNWFWGDYWVIGLTGSYQIAIVGNPNREFGWILSRQTVLDETGRQFVHSVLTDKGYDPEVFEYTSQDQSH